MTVWFNQITGQNNNPDLRKKQREWLRVNLFEQAMEKISPAPLAEGWGQNSGGVWRADWNCRQDCSFETFHLGWQFDVRHFYGPREPKNDFSQDNCRYDRAHFEIINAVTAGLADIRRVVEEAKERRSFTIKTILFIDEIHRFNKLQQDALLPLWKWPDYWLVPPPKIHVRS